MKKFILSAFADEAGSAVSEQIKALQENGMTHLEVRGVNGKNIVDLTLEEAKELKKELDNGGISVWAIGSPLGKISVGDEFAPHLDKMKHTLELADILGTTHIRMFSFFCPKGEADLCRELVFDRLGKFCDAAKGSGILLCHENEKGIYGDTAARCLDIHQNFPELKCVFDPANYLQCGQDTLKAWDMLEPYMEYLHVKDVREDGTVVPAGMGNGHLPELITRYEKIGGKALTVEPHLAVFKGLSELENGEKTKIGEFEYESQRAAFDAAASALRSLLA
ncbi:MAG TPA: sugar phosphate isomerase/epimerase [Candidatus Merdivicinus excrementipullorum]|uniref:Sugar phosphate isomerase/epimerase n=1 Tax=Candidatus Merdivicinus excrementipullorum TaxID=2840867 RepID=A0A9D1FP59_9FIRM|nr:sugar phosphate isomerase/epimerase [Candidatus Merdivicinus excrementipullorum]